MTNYTHRHLLTTKSGYEIEHSTDNRSGKQTIEFASNDFGSDASHVSLEIKEVYALIGALKELEFALSVKE